MIPVVDGRKKLRGEERSRETCSRPGQ